MAAGDAVVGALRVVLSADTADIDKGLKSAKSSFASFATSLGGLATIMGAVFVAVGVGLQKTIADMDKLNKSSQKLGISVEALSSLAFAAELADVSFESLSKGVVKLSKNLVDAAAKPAGDTAKAFKAIGVETTDSSGRLKDADTVLKEVADKFAGLKDGAGKTAIAVALFGRAGADLIPLLNAGGAALQKARDEAQQFGIVVSTTAARAAEQLNDNMTRLGKMVQGVFVQSLEAVLPTMAKLSDKFIESAKNSDFFKEATATLTTTMKEFISLVVLTDATLNALGTSLTAAGKGLLQMAKGDFKTAFETMSASGADMDKIMAEASTTLKELWNGQAKAAADAAVATENSGKKLKDFNFSALAAKNAVDQFIGSQKKSLAGQQAEIATFGQLAGAKEALKLQLQAEATAKENDLVITAKQQAALDLLKQKTSDYALTLEALQLKQANLTPWQAFQVEQAKVQALFDNGLISIDDYQKALTRLATAQGMTWQQITGQIAGNFGQLATVFAKESKGWATTAKALAIFEATVNSYAAFTKALASAPPPLNYALAASTLAAGLAQVLKIKSQTFATGGYVSGAGTATSDSVPAMLSNGEFVMNASATERFRPQLESMNGSAGGGGVGGKIEVSGLRPGDLLTTDMAIAMVDKLSQVAGFGYVIKTRGA